MTPLATGESSCGTRMAPCSTKSASRSASQHLRRLLPIRSLTPDTAGALAAGDERADDSSSWSAASAASRDENPGGSSTTAPWFAIRLNSSAVPVVPARSAGPSTTTFGRVVLSRINASGRLDAATSGSPIAGATRARRPAHRARGPRRGYRGGRWGIRDLARRARRQSSRPRFRDLKHRLEAGDPQDILHLRRQRAEFQCAAGILRAREIARQHAEATAVDEIDASEMEQHVRAHRQRLIQAPLE